MSVTVNTYSIGNFFLEIGHVETIPEGPGNWAIDDKVRTRPGSMDFGFWILLSLSRK